MPSEESEFDLSIARVLNSDNQIAGVGFLITPEYLVTCSHVVDKALDVVEAIPNEGILIDFPFVEPPQTLTTQVARWIPKDREKGDIAILKVTNPHNIHLPSIGNYENARRLVGHHVQTFGFPKGFEDEGRPVHAKVSGMLTNGRLSIVGTSELGLWIEEGFSGAPVWDKDLNTIIGMVVNFDDGVNRSASIIPVDVLVSHIPKKDEPDEETTLLYILSKPRRNQEKRRIKRKIEAVIKNETSVWIGKLHVVSIPVLNLLQIVIEDDMTTTQENQLRNIGWDRDRVKICSLTSLQNVNALNNLVTQLFEINHSVLGIHPDEY